MLAIIIKGGFCDMRKVKISEEVKNFLSNATFLILHYYSYDNNLKGVYVNGYEHELIGKLNYNINLVYEKFDEKQIMTVMEQTKQLIGVARELNITFNIGFKNVRDLDNINEMIALNNSEIIFERDLLLSRRNEDFKNSSYFLENKDVCEIPYANFEPPLLLNRTKL